MDTASDILKQAIIKSGDAMRRIEINTGVNRECVRRFVYDGKDIGSSNFDALAHYYDLTLTPIPTGKAKGKGAE